MTLKLYRPLLIIITLLTFSCSEPNKKKSNTIKTEDTVKKDSSKSIISPIPKTVNNDSIELTNLVREAYKWHESSFSPSIPFKLQEGTDTVFIGVDWDTYDKKTDLIINTNLFTDDFLKKHKMIAHNIDESMKSADVEWRYNEITIWDTEVDDWCSCQDYPDNYWETIKIDSLRIDNNIATFNLNWKFYNSNYSSMDYEIEAKKIESKWRIDYLQGYDNYKTTEEYNQMMSH